ncbi:MAG: hypothetical protein FWD00_01115 [Clostridiales bacterium]|nr:hypothetical protein [Clostridiales bacterium]
MYKQIYEPIEFKYSLQKLLVRFAISMAIVLSGIVGLILLSLTDVSGAHGFVPMLMVGLGLLSAVVPFWRFILNRRVFLILDREGLYYTEIVEGCSIMPRWHKIYVFWSDIESAWIGHGEYLKNRKNSIMLILKEKSRGGHDITRTIRVIYSEYDTEYILQIIRQNIK